VQAEEHRYILYVAGLVAKQNGDNVLKFGSRSILTSRLRSNEYICLKRGIGILHELGEVRLQIRQYHTINRISSGHSYLKQNGDNVLKFGSRSILTSRLRSNEYIWIEDSLSC
jgi:hypothetical protein